MGEYPSYAHYFLTDLFTTEMITCRVLGFQLVFKILQS